MKRGCCFVLKKYGGLFVFLSVVVFCGFAKTAVPPWKMKIKDTLVCDQKKNICRGSGGVFFALGKNDTLSCKEVLLSFHCPKNSDKKALKHLAAQKDVVVHYGGVVAQSSQCAYDVDSETGVLSGHPVVLFSDCTVRSRFPMVLKRKTQHFFAENVQIFFKQDRALLMGQSLVGALRTDPEVRRQNRMQEDAKTVSKSEKQAFFCLKKDIIFITPHETCAADFVMYDAKRKKLFFDGNVTVRKKNHTLFGKSGSYDFGRGEGVLLSDAPLRKHPACVPVLGPSA